ncbi:MAG: hypothetical protein V7742_17840 [Halioglobus sp.]
MNTNFKPLGLVAAVAAATAGYTGVTQAQTFAGTGLGDAAVVPYYTVQGDFVTGVHITNTSDLTQVVKLRYRRASDSMDALDFNIIMSPFDMWTGSIRDVEGTIRVGTTDKSCTAPQSVADTGIAEMGDIFREGAEEGYIEIIGMGSADTTTATWMSLGALHIPGVGVPFDCASVETNFFRNATLAPNLASTAIGVLDDNVSNQACSEIIGAVASPSWVSCAVSGGALGINAGGTATNQLGDTGNVLNVTYFVRSAETGTEFGSRAVHIADFQMGAMMSNQEIIVTGNIDYYSFLYPNLDGGSPAPGAATGTGRFNAVRAALGAQEVINEWSTNAANAVSTDWVVTMPGQYLMLNLPAYVGILNAGGDVSTCPTAAEAAATLPAAVETCDARDLPVVVAIDFWDREEQVTTTPQGGLVISPQTTDQPDTALLPNEVNVIEWTDGTNAPVLDSAYATVFNVAGLGSPNGWAQLSVTSDPTAGKTKGIYQPVLGDAALNLDPFLPVADSGASVPIVGFAAWERSFADNAAASYGRIIDHAYINAASVTASP